MLKHITIIDGNNLFTRGYFIATHLGHDPLEFVVDMILNLKNLSHDRSRFVFTFDTTKSEKRLQLYPEYKAKRKSSLDEEEYKRFRQSLNDFVEIGRVSGCSVLTGHGYEADDYIAAFIQMLKRSYEIVIVSTDNDLYQLITDSVSVYDTYKGIIVTKSKFEAIVGYQQKYFLDVKCMTGDKSDNITGFVRIGEKTALKFINEYGHYYDIVKAIKSKSGQLKKNEEVLLDTELFERNVKLMDLSLLKDDLVIQKHIKQAVQQTTFDKTALHKLLCKIGKTTLLDKVVQFGQKTS